MEKNVRQLSTKKAEYAEFLEKWKGDKSGILKLKSIGNMPCMELCGISNKKGGY